MTLQFKQVIITPEVVDEIYNILPPSEDATTLMKWLSYVKDELYKEWNNLPEGSHLKAAYADDVWSWNDEDICS